VEVSNLPPQTIVVFTTLFQDGVGEPCTIVETYGGKIWAENRRGGGAVFRFTLPLARLP
jgi:hypothetical protein